MTANIIIPKKNSVNKKIIYHMIEYKDKTPNIRELTLCVQTHVANLSRMNQKHKLQEQTANMQHISS